MQPRLPIGGAASAAWVNSLAWQGLAASSLTEFLRDLASVNAERTGPRRIGPVSAVSAKMEARHQHLRVFGIWRVPDVAVGGIHCFRILLGGIGSRCTSSRGSHDSVQGGADVERGV